MTEQCKHEWNWFKYDGYYHCQVTGCDEKRHPVNMEDKINATESLSVEDVRKMVIISDDDWVKATLQAYAFTLEKKP